MSSERNARQGTGTQAQAKPAGGSQGAGKGSNKESTGANDSTDVVDKAQEAAAEAAGGAKEVVEQAKEKAGDVAEQAKQKATEAAVQVREEAESRIDEQTTQAGDRLGSVADALRSTSRDLRERDDALFADYVTLAADQVDQLSGYLQDHSAGDFVNDIRRVAERQPELTVAVALGAGFLLGRFLKSSQPEADRRAQQYGTSAYVGRRQAAPTQGNYAADRAYGAGSASGAPHRGEQPVGS